MTPDMDMGALLPPTPRRDAAEEIMGEEEAMENPASSGANGELLLSADMFTAPPKVGDDIIVRASVTSLGSKIGVMPVEVQGGSGKGATPQDTGEPVTY